MADSSARRSGSAAVRRRLGPPRPARSPARVAVVAVCVLVSYFLAPVNTAQAPVGVLLGLLVCALAFVGVVAAVFAELRTARGWLSGWSLVLALEIALVAFSFAYYFMESRDPGQFAGLSTRIDALYFSTATAATVGYGDVHPREQLARALVTLHMVFDLVFIGAVVTLAKDRMSERRAEAVAAADEEAPDEPG